MYALKIITSLNKMTNEELNNDEKTFHLFSSSEWWGGVVIMLIVFDPRFL